MELCFSIEHEIQASSIVLVSRSENRFECGNNIGVELSLYGLRQAYARNSTMHRTAIGTIGRHRVISVRHRNNS